MTRQFRRGVRAERQRQLRAVGDCVVSKLLQADTLHFVTIGHVSAFNQLSIEKLRAQNRSPHGGDNRFTALAFVFAIFFPRKIRGIRPFTHQ